MASTTRQPQNITSLNPSGSNATTGASTSPKPLVTTTTTVSNTITKIKTPTIAYVGIIVVLIFFLCLLGIWFWYTWTDPGKNVKRKKVKTKGASHSRSANELPSQSSGRANRSLPKDGVRNGDVEIKDPIERTRKQFKSISSVSGGRAVKSESTRPLRQKPSLTQSESAFIAPKETSPNALVIDSNSSFLPIKSVGRNYATSYASMKSPRSPLDQPLNENSFARFSREPPFNQMSRSPVKR